MKPRSMPRAEYDAIDAVHWSTLKEMRKSPLHYRYRELNPLEPTPAMLLGQGAHTAILEPLQFLRDYALFEGERRQGKVWDAFEAANASKTILKRPEYDLCVAMQEAVRAHPEASKYLAAGRAEQVVTWTDEETGLPCKLRADWLCDVPGLAVLIDVKSTATIDAALFGATAARMGHYAQVAMYWRGLQAAGLPMPAKLIAVESKPPHDVAVFDITADVLTAGTEEVRELLQKVAECRAKGKWPGRYAAEQPLQLPAWFYADWDDAGGVFGLDVAGTEV
jgi:exodeoxyribonuclease VIII